MWNPREAYNELAMPPTARLETSRVLKALVEARAALAAFNQAAQRIPNPSILISTIPLLEAQASSEVENIVTTTDDLFRFDAQVETDSTPATKETLRYRSALFAGLESIKNRPLIFATAVEICSEILGRQMQVRDLPGTYIGETRTGLPIYTPPVGVEVIKEKLSEWERFVHGDHDLDPLVTMAAAHYYFEAIHPFTDGNGRTGRILNVLLLIEKGLLDQPILYLSRHLIRNKAEYYDRLLAVTKEHDWEGWLVFMLDAVRATSQESLAMIDAIEALHRSVREELRDVSARGNADLLDLLFEQPYTRISAVMDRCEVSRPTASKWLKEFVDTGALTQIRIGRELLFINHRYLQVLAG